MDFYIWGEDYARYSLFKVVQHTPWQVLYFRAGDPLGVDGRSEQGAQTSGLGQQYDHVCVHDSARASDWLDFSHPVKQEMFNYIYLEQHKTYSQIS